MTSADIWVVTVLGVGAAGFGWSEARDVADPPVRYKTSPHDRNDLIIWPQIPGARGQEALLCVTISSLAFWVTKVIASPPPTNLSPPKTL